MELTEITDCDLGLLSLLAEVRIAEHLEMDCQGGGEYECARCDADVATLKAIRGEFERRSDEGVTVRAATLEEYLGPYGLEWQREQREREGCFT